MLNLTGTRTVETRRLVLRPFRPEDAGDMYANWASDPEVTRYLTWPAHASLDVTRAVLSGWIPRYGEGNYFQWAVEWKETGSVIGSIGVVKLNEAAGAADLGYCLGRAFWGRGIMPEALRAVIGFLFDTVGLNRIAACHDANNPRSGRVMDKAGMKREGVLRGAGVNNLGVCDEVWHAVIRADREPVPKAAPSPVAVRFAREEDLDRVNELRRQVNELHVAGAPEIFRPGFPDELRDYVRVIHRDPQKKIVVAELDGAVCGFAVLNHVVWPENPFMYTRDFLDVDELGVDHACLRRGVAGGMIRFIRNYARKQGFSRLELNMWEFNRGALAFYEASGFSTYRRYMVMKP